ncbi:Kinesin-associated protein 3, partial [Perkinsus olseni]
KVTSWSLMSRTVRKIRLKGMELNADESTIVVNYIQDVCVMDARGKVISTESTPGQKSVRVREVGADLELKADQVMQAASKYIMPKQRDELIRLLGALRAYQGSQGRPGSSRKQGSLRQQQVPPVEEAPVNHYETIFRLLPDASPSSIEMYKDKLYEDTVEEKLMGARYFLRLCVDPRTFEYISRQAMSTEGDQGGFNCTWLTVLARVLREESMGLFDLPTTISACFLCLSTYASLHPLLSASQCGGITLKLVDHEVQERARALRQGVDQCRISQDPGGLAREERKVMKQNKLLRICLLTLLHLAEDVKVERKMVNGKLPTLIARLLDRTWEPLLRVCLVFLKKLSVFGEAKDQMVEAGVLRPLVANCVLRHKSGLVGVLALQVLYNLSFDPEVRNSLSESGVMTALVTILREQPSCRQLVLRLLYHFSFDDRCKSELCFCEDFIPMLLQLVVQFPDPRVGADLMAVMVNMSTHQRSAQLMLQSGLWPDLVHRGIKYRDCLVLKVMRNVSGHGRDLQELFCQVMSNSALSHWTVELVRMARHCSEGMSGGDEKADAAAGIVVEVLGLLANFTTPGTVDWGELCSIDDNGFLLDLVTEQLMPGFTGDDVLLESVMVVGVIAASRDPEVGARLCENPLLLRRLIDLLTAKQEDDEIVLQLLWTFRMLLSNPETSDVVLEDQDAQVVHYMLELIRDSNPMITGQASAALGLVAELEMVRASKVSTEAGRSTSILFDKVRQARFEAYNQAWMAEVERAGESVYYGTEHTGEEASSGSGDREMSLMHHNLAFADMLDDRLWGEEGDEIYSLGSSSSEEHVTYL